MREYVAAVPFDTVVDIEDYEKTQGHQLHVQTRVSVREIPEMRRSRSRGPNYAFQVHHETRLVEFDATIVDQELFFDSLSDLTPFQRLGKFFRLVVRNSRTKRLEVYLNQGTGSGLVKQWIDSADSDFFHEALVNGKYSYSVIKGQSLNVGDALTKCFQCVTGTILEQNRDSSLSMVTNRYNQV